MTTQSIANTRAATGLAPILLTAFIGLGVVFAAGFAASATLHDAAHDGRHSVSFPCH